MERIEWLENSLAQAEQWVYEQRVPEALELLGNLLFEEPGYAGLHNHLGWAYLYYTEDLAKAEMHLRMSVRFNPGYAPAYLHLGTLFNRLGRHSEAIDWLEKGLPLVGANRTAFLEAIGQAYEWSGRYARAIRAYKEAALATVIDPDVDRILLGVKRCRKKRLASLFPL